MLNHESVWKAIDALAQRYDMSASGLAKKAGLDPTSFNKSKRTSADGRPRWPSTESLAKIIEATGASFNEFMGLISPMKPRAPETKAYKNFSAPLLGFAEAGAGGYFDDAGFPVGEGWDRVEMPAGGTDGIFALKISGQSMMPLYRDGDTVVVRTKNGEVMAKVLKRKSAEVIELKSLNPEHEDRQFSPADVEWMARIIWASQ
jgi:phage repressor protein C with HTH and peptisase S24 domain